MSDHSTHRDLARIIERHVECLAAVPTGYMVSDEATKESLRAAARILIEQDKRIASATVVMRECRSALPTQERSSVNEWLSAKQRP